MSDDTELDEVELRQDLYKGAAAENAWELLSEYFEQCYSDIVEELIKVPAADIEGMQLLKMQMIAMEQVKNKLGAAIASGDFAQQCLFKEDSNASYQ